ncbi:SPOSA6832_01377, partial [Sporobolomyces salmonicolor]
MADINAIAKQFTDFYYQQFDSDRSGLAPLYVCPPCILLTAIRHLELTLRLGAQSIQREHSMLTFESQQIQGSAAIVEKLVGLPFSTVQHRVSTMDAQPAATDKASMIVLVTGQLITGDEANALSFSQTFHLIPEGSGYYVWLQRHLPVRRLPSLALPFRSFA